MKKKYDKIIFLKYGRAYRLVKRRIIPDKLIDKKIKKTPFERKDLPWVRWRIKRMERGAMANRTTYSTIAKNSGAKVSRKKIVNSKIKIAMQKLAKDKCNLSFLPVSINERAMMKLVAASVNVSIITFVKYSNAN